MKYAIVALAALASLALASGTNIYDRPGYNFEMRGRLGHFHEHPFKDMFKQYAVAFIKPNFPEREPDDYRNYEPSADGCKLFFNKFIGYDLVLEDLPNLIELDGCLGYVVDKVYEDDKHATEEQKQYFSDLLAKEEYNLQGIYATGIDTFDDKSRSCIASLLHRATLGNAQFRDVECNNHMVQVYLQFAECQSETDLLTMRETDPYVERIYDLLEKRAKKCMDTEVTAIDMAVREKFGSQYFRNAISSLSIKKKGLTKQRKDRMWPSEVVDLLAAVLKTTDKINLREAHQYLYDMENKEDKIIKQFLDNIAYYADQEIKPTNTPPASSQTSSSKLSSKFKSWKNKGTESDPNGAVRYTTLVNKLCNPFRSSDSEKDFDYATSLVRMVRLLNYEEIFGIAKKKFTHDFVTDTHATAPIYFCVSFCNKLSFTEGVIKKSSDGGAHYNVHWIPNTSRMVSWPVAGNI